MANNKLRVNFLENTGLEITYVVHVHVHMHAPLCNIIRFHGMARALQYSHALTLCNGTTSS